MPTVTAVTRGFKSLTDGFKKLARSKPRALRRALKKAGDLVLRESRKIVPMDTGELYRSGFVQVTKNNSDLFEVEVGYSDPKAIYVHEDLEAAHGEQYNIKYSYEIATGAKGYHSRRPQERSKFLTSVIYGHVKDLREMVKQELLNA